MNIEARDQDMVLRLWLTHGWYSIRRGVIYGQVITILLAGLFTYIQLWEYYNAPFTLTDGVFGSTFYFATGFHGLHIIIGSICLLVALCRLATNQMTLTYHLGHESAIIYWHFVDVVWLLLFICIYWWG